MQCPSIKSPLLSYGSDFFPKIRYYYAFIAKQMQKKNILKIKFHPKKIYFQIVLDLIDVYQYPAPLKNSSKNSIHNYSFEIYIQIFKLCDRYYFVKIYCICSNFFMLIDFFKIID